MSLDEFALIERIARRTRARADIVLGIAVSVLKYMLVLSVLFSAFDSLNEDYTLVGPQTIEKSKSYKPVMRLSEAVFPFLEWVGEQVPQEQNQD